VELIVLDHLFNKNLTYLTLRNLPNRKNLPKELMNLIKESLFKILYFSSIEELSAEQENSMNQSKDASLK
jgi:hypothetical protein